ncbi:MAG: asparagine synthase (glutamine-hydrolyzing) [Bdellovibrionales bacterium]|nr:asparagine synthase (glutamine-hydrolyzing) [Bdellovibrionales bacterium]
MCGFAGFVDPSLAPEERQRVLIGMRDTLIHRGPDDGGVYLDRDVPLCLGFRRLAILDLSEEGHQPMCSRSGRYVIAFNGEIYNFQELRHDLEHRGQSFRGGSDTEVLLAAFEEWGLVTTLQRAAGMFAIALWDRERRELTLARDRFGEKPLYYGTLNGVFYFGSELKSFRAHPKWSADVDRTALCSYLELKYVPGPLSIYNGISKLPPGGYLTISDFSNPGTPQQYWSLFGCIRTGIESRDKLRDEEAIEQFDALLTGAVRRQMIADVPLGAFLSGGIDSSTIVSIMQAGSSRPIRTFTIGFHEDRYNEAPHAREVADFLGTDHTELFVTADDARALIPEIPRIWDEPFGDSSQLPTLLVAKLARQHVTVALSGDGGDELLAGYRRYRKAQALEERRRRLPTMLRTLLGSGSRSIADFLEPFSARSALRFSLAGDFLSAATSADLYRSLNNDWRAGRALKAVLGAASRAEPVLDLPKNAEFIDWMQAYDTRYYLPDDILVKVDRATMAVSLESRAPLLDHKLVEFAWRLPLRCKQNPGGDKWILRETLRRYIPQFNFVRRKQGFGLPVAEWLRGPLRPWAEELLSGERIRAEGFLNAELIQKAWRTHLAGEVSMSSQLWTVLMFQAWLGDQRRETEGEKSVGVPQSTPSASLSERHTRTVSPG